MLRRSTSASALVGAGQAAQFLDVFFQAIDFVLAIIRAVLGFVLVFVLAVFARSSVRHHF